MDLVLAKDTGGTSDRFMLREAETNREVARWTIPTRPDDYPGSLRDTATTVHDHLGDHRLCAIGVGVAGAVTNGVITGSANLSNWTGREYAADLSEQFNGVPVTVKNDCVMAALGEYSVLRCSLIYVTWGTGVGVGVVSDIDGRPHARATELGHMIIDRGSRLRCGCGGYGHLEAHVGGANLPQRFRGPDGNPAQPEKLDYNQWYDVLADMASGLRNLSAGDMATPIVLGGGISYKQSDRLPLLQKLVSGLPSTCPAPELLLAEHGEDSGLEGAAYAALQLLQRS